MWPHQLCLYGCTGTALHAVFGDFHKLNISRLKSWSEKEAGSINMFPASVMSCCFEAAQLWLHGEEAGKQPPVAPPSFPILTLYAIFYCPQRSCGKVMLSQASVILFRRGEVCIPACTEADTPWADTPLGRHPSRQTPSWADTPPGRHPPRQTPPSQTPPGRPPNGHCSGRYASYWNAFLFV